MYLFAFCVIQSSLCEMTLLLFKINQMLQRKSVLCVCWYVIVPTQDPSIDQIKFGSCIGKLEISGGEKKTF